MTLHQAQLAMIEGQLLTGRVLNAPILEAMLQTPRGYFVPEALKNNACVDEDIEVAPGRYLMEPLVFARLLEAARVEPTDRVMVIGCLSGYSLAILARMAAQVIGIEEERDLAEKARQNMRQLSISNAEVFTGPLAAGYALSAPYNVIVIEGAVQAVPDALIDQLADGGRLVTVENTAIRPGSSAGLGRVLTVTRSNGVGYRAVGVDAQVPVLESFAAKPSFVF